MDEWVITFGTVAFGALLSPFKVQSPVRSYAIMSLTSLIRPTSLWSLSAHCLVAWLSG